MVMASSRITGNRATVETTFPCTSRRCSSKATAAKGTVTINRDTATISDVLERTASFSSQGYRLMNEGLVTKNSHSIRTQAVPLTRARPASRDIFIFFFEFSDLLASEPTLAGALRTLVEYTVLHRAQIEAVDEQAGELLDLLELEGVENPD